MIYGSELLTCIFPNSYSSVGGSCIHLFFVVFELWTYNIFFTGVRVSLYNAITEEQTDQLVGYIDEFVHLGNGE